MVLASPNDTWATKTASPRHLGRIPKLSFFLVFFVGVFLGSKKIPSGCLGIQQKVHWSGQNILRTTIGHVTFYDFTWWKFTCILWDSSTTWIFSSPRISLAKLPSFGECDIDCTIIWPDSVSSWDVLLEVNMRWVILCVDIYIYTCV